MVNLLNKTFINPFFSIEIEWQLIYIGSAKDEKYDQILDSFSMGPLAAGIMQFVLEVLFFFIFYL